jgi:hypothetical protein
MASNQVRTSSVELEASLESGHAAGNALVIDERNSRGIIGRCGVRARMLRKRVD